MKILLDECVTKKLKTYLTGHEVYTVTEMGWSGLFNGKLITKCVDENFDILLTVDKNVLYQQSIVKYNITVVVFDAVNSKIDTLLPFIETFEKQAHSLEKYRLYTFNSQLP